MSKLEKFGNGLEKAASGINIIANLFIWGAISIFVIVLFGWMLFV